MSKILKNTTGSAINLSTTGLSIAASGQLDVEKTDYLLLASTDSVTELTTLINSGDIVVNDGTNNLSASDGIAYIKYAEDAQSIRFISPGAVLTSTNVETALDEAGNKATTALITPRYTIVLQHNGTVSNNTFIGYSSLIPGDATPIVIPIKSTLKEIAFSNKISADFTLEFRKNTTGGTAFKSISKVTTKIFSDQTFTETFVSGDSIYVKYIDTGTNASDAAVLLVFQATP